MKKDPIRYTCPKCGAQINDLKQIVRPSSRNKPKMSFRCLICEHTFDVVGDHCMQIYRETRRAERIAASRYQSKNLVEALA